MKNISNIARYTFIFFFLHSLITVGITRVSIGNGNWANAATWSPAGVPGCGDSIVVNINDTVIFTNQQNYASCPQAMKVIVKGTIWFYNGSKLRLPCGSYLLVYPGGSCHADVGLANSNLIEICGVVEWNSNSVLYGPSCLPANHPFCSNVVLPVELNNFKVEICEWTKTCLSWETFSEKNNQYFEVQRSGDAVVYAGINNVLSQAKNGNSTGKISYSAVDVSPLKGINYYRLMQVDKDLTKTYSNVIKAESVYDKKLQFGIFPTINSGEFTARISGLQQSGDIEVMVKDASGFVVYKSLHRSNGISAEFEIDPVYKLPNGFYFCSFSFQNVEHVVKMIVAN